MVLFGSFALSAADSPEALYEQLLHTWGRHYTDCLQTSAPVKSGSWANVAVLLDASGPTKGYIDRTVTLDLMKEAALRFVRGLPAETRVSVVVYGQHGNMSLVSQDESCAGIDLLGPGRGRALTQLSAVHSGGWTPLQKALQKAAESLTSGGAETAKFNYVYVFASGMDTCGGHPVQAAREIHAGKGKPSIYVLSPAASAAEQDELRHVASAGGGQFLQVRNAIDLHTFLDAHARSLASGGGERPSAAAASKVNQACVETRLAAERSAIEHELGAGTIDPAAAAVVRQKLKARQDGIRAAAADKDVTAEQLESGMPTQYPKQPVPR